MWLARLLLLVPIAAYSQQCVNLSNGVTISTGVTLGCGVAAPVSGCGPPHYQCARSDWNTFTLDATTMVPPSAGPHTCIAGDTATGLLACGNSTGINTVINEPAYNGTGLSQILRVSDYGDLAECGWAMVGGGGNAGQNTFDTTGQYFRMGNCLKWLDTANFQINTCAHRGLSPPACSPAGYVLTSTGTLWTAPSTTILASYLVPGKFYIFPGGSTVQSLIVSNGVAGAPTTVVDLSWGVPCWMDSAGCGNWQAAHSYSPGSNLCPGCYTPTPPANNSGRCVSATATPLCAHSFQLLNAPGSGGLAPSPCSSGTTEPDWNSAFGNPTANWQTVITDGTCQWADMGPPVSAPGASVYYGVAAFIDVTDNIFNRGMSNWKGQDQGGACFVSHYTLSTNTFRHLNTCTGAIYTITCSGGTGYQCTGGTRTVTYEGNYFTSPRITSQDYRRYLLHSADMSQSGTWVTPSHNNCALKDIAGNFVLCEPAATSPSGPGTTNVNGSFWFPYVGPNNSIDAYSLIGTSTPGHMSIGYDLMGGKNQSNYIMNQYFGVNMMTPSANQGTGMTQPVGVIGNSQGCVNPVPNALLPSGYLACTAAWFNITPILPNADYPAAAPDTRGGNCLPDPCAGPYSTTNLALGVKVQWDQHVSWVTNRGGDSVPSSRLPVCMEAYGSSWPWTVPWLGEVMCWATDGSNRQVREAQTYNTLTSSNMFPNGTGGTGGNFNSVTMIGQYSQDGRYWTFNSNWFCTLGTRTTTGAVLCGFPFQASHAYQVGDLVGAIWQQNSSTGAAVGGIYKVTTAGTSDSLSPCATSTSTSSCNPSTGGYWCTSIGAACNFAPTITSGSAVLTYQGPSNELVSVFLVKMQ